MNTQKKSGETPARTSPPTTTTTTASGRQPWKKKTPVEIVLSQLNRQRDDVAKREEELREAKRQLEKLEAAKKVLEGA